MSLEMACTIRCIIALVAFIWLFSTVCFQMSFQVACTKRCIFTLAAFAWHQDTFWPFQKDICTCVFFTQVTILKSLLHYHYFHLAVLCPKVALKWGKSKTMKDLWIRQTEIESEVGQSIFLDIFNTLIDKFKSRSEYPKGLQAHSFVPKWKFTPPKTSQLSP